MANAATLYEQLASLLGIDPDDVRWFTWLSLWRLVGMWCLQPPHVREIVGLPPVVFFAPSVER